MTTLIPNRIYIDLDYNFTLHPDTHDVARVVDVNSVKQSVKTLVLTQFGEKPFQPNVGSPVYGLLFEPDDEITVELVKQSIIQTITNEEPRCVLNNVNVSSDPDNNAFNVTISYTVVGIALPASFTFVLQRLR
jgi:phage baseplate assembly protein W